MDGEASVENTDTALEQTVDNVGSPDKGKAKDRVVNNVLQQREILLNGNKQIQLFTEFMDLFLKPLIDDNKFYGVHEDVKGIVSKYLAPSSVAWLNDVENNILDLYQFNFRDESLAQRIASWFCKRVGGMLTSNGNTYYYFTDKACHRAFEALLSSNVFSPDVVTVFRQDHYVVNDAPSADFNVETVKASSVKESADIPAWQITVSQVTDIFSKD